MPKVISMEDCIDGHLYQVIARNAIAGIWRADKKHFTIRRTKFSSIFLCQELHWDASDRHGTAQPIRELGEAPDLEGQELIGYLKQAEDDIEEKYDLPHWTHQGTDESREKYGNLDSWKNQFRGVDKLNS
jgi:hypothetical protein